MNLPEFFGLDIGNHSIRVAQIRWVGGKPMVIKLGSVATPYGASDLNDDNAITTLADKIKELVLAADIKTNKVVAALPEPVVFSRIVEVPKSDDAKLEEVIYWEAKQYIPTPLEDVNLDYIKIQDKQKGKDTVTQALLVAAPKKIIKQYQVLVERSGLELIALETESIASARVMTHQKRYEKPLLVLDFGANGTDMSVIKSSSLIFAQTLGTGSDTLTKAISNDFGITLDQAEQYKRAYGLKKDQGEGKIANSLIPVMEIIVNEINKTVNYFKAHLQEGTPQQIYVIGEGSKLPGLPEFLTERIGIPSTVFGINENIGVDRSLDKEIAQVSMIGFTVSIGLAMKTE